jgi:hypothetical protein
MQYPRDCSSFCKLHDSIDAKRTAQLGGGHKCMSGAKAVFESHVFKSLYQHTKTSRHLWLVLKPCVARKYMPLPSCSPRISFSRTRAQTQQLRSLTSALRTSAFPTSACSRNSGHHTTCGLCLQASSCLICAAYLVTSELCACTSILAMLTCNDNTDRASTSIYRH